MKKKKPEPKGIRQYAGLRIWAETVDKWRAIARYFRIPMTRLFDQIADGIMLANGIDLDTDPRPLRFKWQTEERKETEEQKPKNTTKECSNES